MKFRHLEISSILFALLLSPLSAEAAPTAGSPEVVTNFSAVGTLNRSDVLDVAQEIDYDFGSVAPHDITFSVPISYHDDQGLEYRVHFRLISAKSGTQAVVLKTTSDPQVEHLTLPAGTSSDNLRHFSLRYQLSPMAIVADKGDVFRLATTGISWTVPLNRVYFELHTPVPVQNVLCTTGAQTTDSNNCETDQGTTTVSFVNITPIPAGGGMSVLCSFDHGSFTTYLQAYSPPGGWIGLVVTGGIIIVVLLAIPVIVIIRSRRRRKQKFVGATRPDYTKDNDSD